MAHLAFIFLFFILFWEGGQTFFADRTFKLLDKDQDGSISRQELMEGLYLLTKGTAEQRLRFLFDVYDLDGEIRTSVFHHWLAKLDA